MKDRASSQLVSGPFAASAQGKPTSKAPAQREKILALLRGRGSAGATNSELNEIGFRYGARIWELRKMGFEIRTLPEGEATFRFVLEAEPAASARSKPAPAAVIERPQLAPRPAPSSKQEQGQLF